MSTLVCLAHPLTAEQEIGLNEKGDIVLLKDYAPELYGQLVSCPDTYPELEVLAERLMEVMGGYASALLPIGSPAFMAILSATERKTSFLFAHSKRVSVEDPETGVKTSVFKHLKFIEV